MCRSVSEAPLFTERVFYFELSLIVTMRNCDSGRFQRKLTVRPSLAMPTSRTNDLLVIE